jgi:hypothetical protein
MARWCIYGLRRLVSFIIIYLNEAVNKSTPNNFLSGHMQVSKSASATGSTGTI